MAALSTPAPTPAPTAAPSAPAGSTDALRRDLQALLQQERLAGAVVATVDGLHSERLALGVFHTGTQQPLLPGHRVQVGSIAKTVLALAALRLVSQGRVALDDPVQTLLPHLHLHNPWAGRSPVRLRHLLDMSAGLPDLQLWHIFHQGHHPQQPLALALRPEQGPLHLRSEPGRQFGYSNLGYTLVGMVIEAVTQEPYEAWARRELLLPLGLRDSDFHFRTQAHDPALAWGHLDDGQPVADWPVAVRPAAHFSTTAGDMARLMQFLLADGQLQGRPYIRADLMAGLGLAPGTRAARAGLRTGYGLGLFTRDRHGAVGLCHGGSVAGWRAQFCVFREQQRGFFIAFNSDREDARHDRFYDRLVQHLGVARPLPDGAASAAAGAADAAAADAAAAGTLAGAVTAEPTAAAAAAADGAAHRVDGFSGLYVPAPGRLQALALPDRLLGAWQLDLQPGRATLREGVGGPARTLWPAGPGLWRQADRQQATLALLHDAQGRPLLAGSYLTLRRVSPWEQAALWVAAGLGAVSLVLALPLGLWRGWQARRPPLSHPATPPAAQPAAHGAHPAALALRGAAAGWRAAAQAPCAAAVLTLVLALAAWAAQGWQRLAEPTFVAAAVAAATLLWPLACGAQLWQACLRGQRAWPEAAVAAAGLVGTALLATFGWLPLVPWRL